MVASDGLESWGLELSIDQRDRENSFGFEKLIFWVRKTNAFDFGKWCVTGGDAVLVSESLNFKWFLGVLRKKGGWVLMVTS